MVRAFGMNQKVVDSSPSGRDIFCLKNVDTFTKTPVRVSNMDAVARAQLTFQIIKRIVNKIWILNSDFNSSWISMHMSTNITEL